MTGESQAGVDLYWLPLGAGGRSVRLNGRIFEAVAAQLERRPAADLYYSALTVRVPAGDFVVEMAPIRDAHGAERGVVAEGPVGSRWARWLCIFRYENRRWRDGLIPDVGEAVESPHRLSDDRRSRSASSTSCPTHRRRSGDATSSGRARCGTRTRSSPGCWRAAASASRRFVYRPAAVRPAGTPDSWWPNVAKSDARPLPAPSAAASL